MLIFWDIDGTLLTTGRAGIFAWEEALREVAGVSADLADFDTAGHPDHGIASRLLNLYGRMPEPASTLVQELVAQYEAHLPAALHRRQGRVLPNVREILERLAGEPDVHSYLLTGNTRRGAVAKLSHYGLRAFFGDDALRGAFSEANADRVAIAHAALVCAADHGRRVPPDRTFVVGDTPHDVRCGAAIGARTVAVATGGYSLTDLATTRPWRALPQLPPPDEFWALLAGREVSEHV